MRADWRNGGCRVWCLTSLRARAGREVGKLRNEARFDDICLQPRVMENVASRSLATEILGQEFGVPFGIAPMGMCNLVCPGADRILAETAARLAMPVCVSSAASSTLEDMREWAGTPRLVPAVLRTIRRIVAGRGGAGRRRRL